MDKRDNARDLPRPSATGGAPHYSANGQRVAVPTLAGGLYVVATPIGNLADISLRALATLAAADVIACEDTRVTRKLTEHYGIGTPLTPYHEHNAAAVRPKILAQLARGSAVALVSDAGTPLISDPGFKLVRAAREAGHAVTALPGASAVLAALTVSALPTDAFLFEGFLPAKEAQRQKRIAEIKLVPASLILFETGPRVGATLADLAAALAPREAAVCRELTKLYEEVRRGDLAELARHYAQSEAPRGEIVIVIAPPAEPVNAAKDVDDLLRQALTRVSLKEAVAEIATVTGEPRRTVYQRALALAQGAQPDESEAQT